MVLIDNGGRDGKDLDLLAPPRDLSDVIEHVWIERRAPVAPATWRVVADTAPYLIATVSSGSPAQTLSVRLVGARSCAADIDVQSRALTIGVRLRPGTLPVLTDLSAREFRDRSVPVADVFGASVLAGLELDAGAPVIHLVRELMQFARRARRRSPATPLLPDSDSSPKSVADLADWLGAPTRSMRERFHREVGLSPKRMLRVERLHAALHAARRPSRSFAQIAHLAGYADQAHFNREVRALLGETPSAWHARASAVSFKTPADATA